MLDDKDTQEFFADLKKSLEAKIDGKTAESKTGVKDPDGALEEIRKMLDNAGESILIKAFAELAETVEGYGEVLEKILDRMEAYEKGTAVRKGLNPDDLEDGAETVSKAKGEHQFDGPIRKMLETGKPLSLV